MKRGSLKPAFIPCVSHCAMGPVMNEYLSVRTAAALSRMAALTLQCSRKHLQVFYRFWLLKSFNEWMSHSSITLRMFKAVVKCKTIILKYPAVISSFNCCDFKRVSFQYQTVLTALQWMGLEWLPKGQYSLVLTLKQLVRLVLWNLDCLGLLSSKGEESQLSVKTQINMVLIALQYPSWKVSGKANVPFAASLTVS